MSKGSYNDFLDALGQRESGGRYSITNWAGYLGKYQIGEAALKDAGYFIPSKGTNRNDNVFTGTWTGKNGITSKQNFLNNPKGQEAAIRDYMQVQWRYLENLGCTKYIGKTINGMKITPSGLLAASHLVGVGYVQKYLKSDGKNIKADGNGVTLETYLKKFNNYDTPFANNASSTKVQTQSQNKVAPAQTSQFNPYSKAGQVFASYEDGLWYSNPMRDLQQQSSQQQGNGKYANVQKNAMFERLGIEDMHAKYGHLMDGPWVKDNYPIPDGNEWLHNSMTGNVFGDRRTNGLNWIPNSGTNNSFMMDNLRTNNSVLVGNTLTVPTPPPIITNPPTPAAPSGGGGGGGSSWWGSILNFIGGFFGSLFGGGSVSVDTSSSGSSSDAYVSGYITNYD